MNLRTGALRLVLIIVVFSAIGWALLNRTMFDADAINTWLASWGWWSPLIFIGLWAVWALLFLPGAILGIAGGVFFGPVWGSMLTLIGATLGAVLAFSTSRYIASDWVTQKAGGRLKQLLDGVESEGWRFVAFTRLVPLFPFNFLNYALGLTHIRMLSYTVTTFICMAPGTVAYAYLGYAGREAIAGGEELVGKGLMALGLLVAVAFLPRLVRHVRRQPQIWIEVDALKKRLQKGDEITVLDVRDPNEYGAPSQHIPGSKNIPLGELAERMEELRLPSDQTLALICKTDKRSAYGARLLQENGFQNVTIVRGGMEQWNVRTTM